MNSQEITHETEIQKENDEENDEDTGNDGLVDYINGTALDGEDLDAAMNG